MCKEGEREVGMWLWPRVLVSVGLCGHVSTEDPGGQSHSAPLEKSVT